MAVIFYDDFESYSVGSLLSSNASWTDYGDQYDYIFSNGTAKYLGATEVSAIAEYTGLIGVSDYSVSAKIRNESGSVQNEISLGGRIDSGNGFAVVVGSDGAVTLIESIDLESTIVGSYDASSIFVTGEEHTIKLSMDGTSIAVSIDGTLPSVIQYNASSSGAPGVCNIYMVNSGTQYNASYDLSNGGLFVADFGIDTIVSTGDFYGSVGLSDISISGQFDMIQEFSGSAALEGVGIAGTFEVDSTLGALGDLSLRNSSNGVIVSVPYVTNAYEYRILRDDVEVRGWDTDRRYYDTELTEDVEYTYTYYARNAVNTSAVSSGYSITYTPTSESMVSTTAITPVAITPVSMKPVALIS